jgi:tRNA threonylcarbamoyladenosine biosynthesis protein TsaE
MRLSEAELRRWGRSVGELIATPAVIVLSGPLGAGKSVLARSIGEGAGVAEPMPSPTHNLALRYRTPSGNEVVHLDLHRLASADEVWELGWEQLGADREIVLVEWPERAAGLLPADRWLVTLSVPRDARTLRDVDVTRVGGPPELPPFPLSVAHTEA